MNLLLFSANEIQESNKVLVTDYRASHLIAVLGVSPGQKIKAGLIGGNIGIAKVLEVENTSVTLEWLEREAPPPPLDCVLIMALPRPKMMKRILQNVSAMGVKELHLINSWKVEKSYWESPALTSAAIDIELIQGLSQAGDTRLTKVIKHKLFKPFAQDILPSLCRNRLSMVAHPYNAEKCPIDVQGATALAIGPEGGFTDYEVGLLIEAGMMPVNIGPRILRVETAIPSILSRLHPA